jgi:EPS-associated MarR family transcriptional regulator
MNQSTENPNLSHEKKLLDVIAANPEITQRELSDELGLSLGKTNFVLKALIDRGLVKVENFKRSNNKMGYAYLLTPQGVSEKVKITKRFLVRKMAEFDQLKAEIENLQEEVSKE